MMTHFANDTGPTQATRWPQSADDRRESPRVPLTLCVGDEAELLEGDASLGGIGWLGRERACGARVDLLLGVTGEAGKLRLSVEVFRVTPAGDLFRVQARFVELSLDAELTIARWLHEETRPQNG